MLPSEQELQIVPLQRNPVDVHELEYIAFSGRSEIAHGIFKSIDCAVRQEYANKYILHEVVVAGVKKLRTYLAASADEAANEEKAFIDETIELFISTARRSGSFPRELFDTLLMWSDELTKLSLLREALRLYDEALAMGVHKFPELYVQCLVSKAGVLNTLGRFRETQSLLSSLAERPYRVTDRNLVPALLFSLGQESLLKGDIDFYKMLLFRGLRHFYAALPARKQFVDQILKTYRHSSKVVLARNVPFSDKILFLIHRLYFIIESRRISRLVGLQQLSKLAVLGYVYAVNYFFLTHTSAALPRRGLRIATHRKQRHFLVTRAMGGIGDLLMMTPGIHALKQKFPQEEVHVAIPKRYFPVFHNNPDVTLLDIEHESFDHHGYKRWFNLTDCPAARIESRTAPKVRKNRIELFARGLSVGRFAARAMDRRPKYFVTEEERSWQKCFWSEHGLSGKLVVGVQLHSDEIYRDYPHMARLVHRLAETYHVLVFDVEPIRDCDGPNIVKVEGLPMRQAFALASACTAIVAPDSAFVHLAAAFDLPCVALYGPVDGEVRTTDYPKCRYLDARAKLGCMPCWRNDKIPCKLTNMRTSICMADISLDDITSTLNTLLEEQDEN